MFFGEPCVWRLRRVRSSRCRPGAATRRPTLPHELCLWLTGIGRHQHEPQPDDIVRLQRLADGWGGMKNCLGICVCRSSPSSSSQSWPRRRGSVIDDTPGQIRSQDRCGGCRDLVGARSTAPA
jgi:hypothetical protein